jgi:hypothetical protein
MPKTSLSPTTITVAKTIARAEWDFHACPDDRAYLCFTYEYARQIPQIVERFRYDQKHDPAQFDELGTWHYVVASEGDNISGMHIEAVDAPVGFPETPYLLAKHLVSIESYSPFLIGREPVRHVIVKKDGGYEADDWYSPDALLPEQVSHLQIDWHSTDHAILKSMAKLLKKMRGGRKPVERRGTNEVARCHADLKALGAWRLIEHFGSAVAAQAYTAKLGLGGGWGLYANQAEWSEAKKRVRAIIDLWLKP